jgi:hypothetical protein
VYASLSNRGLEGGLTVEDGGECELVDKIGGKSASCGFETPKTTRSELKFAMLTR